MPQRLIRKAVRQNNNVLVVNAATLILIFSSFITNYINSSYLQQFISSEAIGLIYTLSAALAILIFLFVSRILKRDGNYWATLGLILLNFCAVGGMAFADSLRTAVPLFIISLTSITLIFFNFDIFLEEAIGKQEGSTGSRRGLLLALSSFVGACTPLFSGYLVGESVDFARAYYVSALTLIPLFALVLWRFKRIGDPKNHEVRVLAAIRSFWVHKDIRFVFLSNLLLWFFFCFMVVYTPLYLSTEMDFSWEIIGLILFGGQLAYVFFEYPIGRLADQYFGEKEMMAFGFLIISTSSAVLAYLSNESVWMWVLVMFLTRTGASLIEVTTESYFFKHTKGSDGQIISFFRMANPIAYIAGPLVVSLSLLYLPFNLTFVVLGLCMLPGALFATYLHDTK